ncbi:MAG TPA: ABC transporter substrate-binding protein [Acidimicrobiales bacterium]|nr:ABC transporter substrate-binding protein [Acidimicrobiales bacterium]
MVRNYLRILMAAVALLAGAACGGDGGSPQAANKGEVPDGGVLRLGYFPNLTHATALFGVEKGIFAESLKPTRFETRTFNAGPEAIEALFGGALDAAYVGPSPAINAYAKSDGKAIRIIAGATSGGALLVTRSSITSPAQLKGRKVASPQLGGTQDVALRSWLKSKGLSTTTSGGGDVSIVPQANADTLTAFRSGTIDGAWVPEPWATRLVSEGGGRVLVDEADLWPGRRFVTTHLIVRTEYLAKHPDAVRRLLNAHVEATILVSGQRANAQAAANERITRITGKGLAPEILAAAWKNLEFTWDPIASSLRKSAADAQAVGLLEKVELAGIYDLKLLNLVLAGAGKPPVKGE